ASRFGLKMNALIDERLIAEKNTRAAVRYLSLLREQFDIPDLQLAAWFCGVAGIKKAIKRSGGKTGLWEIYNALPQEERGFIPAFFAACYCIEHKDDFRLQAYAIQLPEVPDTVLIKKKLLLNAITAVSGIKTSSLREANNWLCGHAVPAPCPYPIQLSEADGRKFRKFRDSMYVYQDSVLLKKRKAVIANQTHFNGKQPPGTKEVYYTIRSGDNLGFIAERFHVTAAALRAWNDLEGDMIYVGQVLRLFTPANSKSKTALQKKKQATQQNARKHDAPKGDYIYHTVKEGESLWLIAKKYPGVSAEDIMELNHIGKDIKPGQKLRIRKK
ncbi:MAG: LysM peptidoglycan-binding domain-containing protein, partial [Flavobacteriales bacterium]